MSNEIGDLTFDRDARPPAAQVWALLNDDKLESAIFEFLGAHQASLRLFRQPEELLTALTPLRPPTLLILDLFLPKTFYWTLKEVLRKAGCREVKALVVSRKDETADYRNRAAELPNARLVAGAGRLVHRVLECVGEQLGFSLPRSERVSATFPGELRNSAGDRRVPLKTVDVSDSGVRIACRVDLASKSQWHLHLTLPDGPWVALVEVIRSFLDRTNDVWQVGLRFVQVRPDDRERMAQTILKAPPVPVLRPVFVFEGEPERSSIRVATPQRLGLKARISQNSSPARFYLQVIDLSPMGFRGRWVSESPIPITPAKGDLFEVALSWPGHSINVSAEMTWAKDRQSAQGLEMGFQFRSVSREAGLHLSRLISTAMERGIKGR